MNRHKRCREPGGIEHFVENQNIFCGKPALFEKPAFRPDSGEEFCAMPMKRSNILEFPLALRPSGHSKINSKHETNKITMLTLLTRTTNPTRLTIPTAIIYAMQAVQFPKHSAGFEAGPIWSTNRRRLGQYVIADVGSLQFVAKLMLQPHHALSII